MPIFCEAEVSINRSLENNLFGCGLLLGVSRVQFSHSTVHAQQVGKVLTEAEAEATKRGNIVQQLKIAALTHETDAARRPFAMLLQVERNTVVLYTCKAHSQHSRLTRPNLHSN